MLLPKTKNRNVIKQNMSNSNQKTLFLWFLGDFLSRRKWHAVISRNAEVSMNIADVNKKAFPSDNKGYLPKLAANI